MQDNTSPDEVGKMEEHVNQWFEDNYPGQQQDVLKMAIEHAATFYEAFPDGTEFTFLFKSGDWWFNTKMTPKDVTIIDVMDLETGTAFAAKINSSYAHESDTVH